MERVSWMHSFHADLFIILPGLNECNVLSIIRLVTLALYIISASTIGLTSAAYFAGAITSPFSKVSRRKMFYYSYYHIDPT